MICPECGNKQNIVMDSRDIRHSNIKWRRRKCKECGCLWYTTETISDMTITQERMKGLNWKTEAIAKLQAYGKKLKALEVLPDEIQRLKLSYSAIRSAQTDATPITGGTNQREDALINNIAQRGELELRLKDAELWVNNVDKALSAIDADQRQLLEWLCIYPHKGAINRVKEAFNLNEDRSVYYRRNKALEAFTMAYYAAILTE